MGDQMAVGMTYKREQWREEAKNKRKR